jgi:hypothetical protein
MISQIRLKGSEEGMKNAEAFLALQGALVGHPVVREVELTVCCLDTGDLIQTMEKLGYKINEDDDVFNGVHYFAENI